MMTPNYIPSFSHMMDIGMIYDGVGGRIHPSRRPNPSNIVECHTRNILVEKSLADRNYRCEVQVHRRHHYIIITYTAATVVTVEYARARYFLLPSDQPGLLEGH